MVLERGGGGGVLWYSFSRYSFWQFMRGLTDIGFLLKHGRWPELACV